ncbi:MAG: hypothetical protein IKS48_04015 [Eubacterium sp.]|nr:hypothetical protein [Eubacterium sp.]
MKEKYKRNVIKTLIILFIVFLLMLVGYINLGSTSMKVISESDKIKIDKIECRYLNSDPPVKVKILNNISNNGFFQKGMKYGKYEYTIQVSDSRKTRVLRIYEFKSNWYQNGYFEIIINDLTESYINIRVVDGKTEIKNEKFDSMLNEIDLGTVE